MLNLQISEEGAEVEIISNGVSHWKKVEPQALMEVLNEAVLDIKKEEEKMSSPILPMGTLGYQEYRNQNAYTIVMYREPRIAEITFINRTYEVGYPRLIYVFGVTNQSLTSTSIFAIKDQVINPNTELFRYPYFNAYDDGRICMGGNHMPIQEPWQLHKMPDIITSMPGNNDLHVSNQSGLQGDSLLKAIEGKPFPEEWLTPTKKILKNLF